VAVAARAAGYDVAVASPPGDTGPITAHGFAHHAFPLSRGGTNPIADALTVLGLVRLFRRVRPDIVHAVAIKAVAYGGIAARIAGVPALVSAISGLGHSFVTRGPAGALARAAVTALFRLAFAHPQALVIFQNDDDRKLIAARVRLPAERAAMIRGSGVDLEAFVGAAEPAGTPIVALPARMLRDKGIPEFVEAARRLKAEGLAARFVLVGAVDSANPASLDEASLRKWEADGLVEWWGRREDMPAVLQSAHLVVLPSFYGEGLPKVLLEAAASARAVVTTNVPGCRDAVEPGVTGLLVPARDPVALADAVAALVRDPDRRRRMGQAGRALAERRFGVAQVVETHLALYRQLEAAAPRTAVPAAGRSGAGAIP
jgi:glycosyltransferase involved in cell wall biosynthesis